MTFSTLTRKALTAAAGVAVTVGLSGGSAMAISITQETSGNLVTSLLGNTTGLSNFSVTSSGDAQAFGLFTNDTTFGLGSGAVLSTGRAVAIPGQNTASSSTNDLSTNLPGTDDINLNISFDADASANKLFFQYVFGSEEFKEFVGSNFNDSFELSLNGVNLAKLSNGNPVTINNLPSTNPDYIDNPAGLGTSVKLDGFTKILTFEGLLNKSASNTLSIRLRDVGDENLDSAVFIKGGTLGVTPPTNVPTPALLPGLIGLGFSVLRKRKAKTAEQAIDA